MCSFSSLSNCFVNLLFCFQNQSDSFCQLSFCFYASLSLCLWSCSCSWVCAFSNDLFCPCCLFLHLGLSWTLVFAHLGHFLVLWCQPSKCSIASIRLVSYLWSSIHLSSCLSIPISVFSVSELSLSLSLLVTENFSLSSSALSISLILSPLSLTLT